MTLTNLLSIFDEKNTFLFIIYFLSLNFKNSLKQISRQKQTKFCDLFFILIYSYFQFLFILNFLLINIIYLILLLLYKLQIFSFIILRPYSYKNLLICWFLSVRLLYNLCALLSPSFLLHSQICLVITDHFSCITLLLLIYL